MINVISFFQFILDSDQVLNTLDNVFFSIKTLQPNTIANLPFPVANNAVIESANTII